MNKKAVYKGFALVNKPSNEFYVIFRADRREVENIKEKIIPLIGKLEIVEIEVKLLRLKLKKFRYAKTS